MDNLFSEVIYGDNVTVWPGAVIGRVPMVPSGVTKNANRRSGLPVKIGDNSIIGANAVIYENVVIGKNCLIGDGVKLRDGCVIGDNCILGMNTKVGNRTVIGNRVKVMDLCNISGDMVIEDGVFVGQGTMCANDNYMGRDSSWQGGVGENTGTCIKKFATIGMNSTLLPNVEIGENAIVGAGSVVTNDVPAKSVVMGNPARYKRMLTEEEIIKNE